jgi:hypothetical protein
MKVPMNTYPCDHLRPLEAQFLWYLAEQSYAEVGESKDEPPTLQDGPAHSRLFQALDALGEPAYHDFLALMWFGRGDDTSYRSLRDRACSEHHRAYCADKGLVLHRYIRTALEHFGVPALHPLGEHHYSQPAASDECGVT